MRYTKSFLFLLPVILIVFTLSACSNVLDLDGGYSASFVGHMVQIGEEYAPLTDIYPGENYLELYDDGTGVIAFSGFEEPLTWTNEGATYTLIFQNEPSVGTLSNGILELDVEGNIVTYVAEGAKSPEIPTTEPVNYDDNPYSAYGTYQGRTISDGYNVADMVEYYKGPCSLFLDTDGLGVLTLGGSKLTIAWELEGEDLTIADEFGINSFGILSEGVIVLDYKESGLQLAFSKDVVEE